MLEMTFSSARHSLRTLFVSGRASDRDRAKVYVHTHAIEWNDLNFVL